MPRHQAVRRSRKTAVGQQADRFAETRAGEGGRNRQHLPHPRSASWPFATDHQDVSLLDLTILNGLEGGLFTFEHAGRTLVEGSFGSGDFQHAAVWREVAVEYHEATLRLERIIKSPDDFLARRLGGILYFLGQSASGHGHGITVEEAGLEKAP